MSGTAVDVHRAIAAAWEAQGLGAAFRSYWNPEQQSRFTTLNEMEAAPQTPFPYCVIEQATNTEITRMSGTGAHGKKAIKRIPFLFHIYTKAIGSDSAKTLAAALAELVLGVYGGHPTVVPRELETTSGCVLNCQLVNDYSVKEGDSEHRWVIEYAVTYDSSYMTV